MNQKEICFTSFNVVIKWKILLRFVHNVWRRNTRAEKANIIIVRSICSLCEQLTKSSNLNWTWCSVICRTLSDIRNVTFQPSNLPCSLVLNSAWWFVIRHHIRLIRGRWRRDGNVRSFMSWRIITKVSKDGVKRYSWAIRKINESFCWRNIRQLDTITDVLKCCTKQGVRSVATKSHDALKMKAASIHDDAFFTQITIDNG
jgi:hypothetical protein